MERIGLNASFEAAMVAWLTTSRGFLTMPVMQPSPQPVSLQLRNIFPDAKLTHDDACSHLSECASP